MLGAVALLVVRVGLMHACHVGRLAGLGVVGAAALPELNRETRAVLDSYVVLDDMQRVADIPSDAVLIADSHGVADIHILRHLYGLARRE